MHLAMLTDREQELNDIFTLFLKGEISEADWLTEEAKVDEQEAQAVATGVEPLLATEQ